MGVFTRIEDAEGRVLQIKFGNDTCETYKVGEEIDFYVNPHRVDLDAAFDGVYDGYMEGDEHGDYGFAVIKDHVVKEMVLAPADYDERWELEQSLYQKWGPFPAYKSYFTAEAWAEYERKRAEAKERHDREYREWLAKRGKTPETASLADAMAWPVATSMNYQSIGRALLIVDEK